MRFSDIFSSLGLRMDLLLHIKRVKNVSRDVRKCHDRVRLAACHEVLRLLNATSQGTFKVLLHDADFLATYNVA